MLRCRCSGSRRSTARERVCIVASAARAPGRDGSTAWAQGRDHAMQASLEGCNCMDKVPVRSNLPPPIEETVRFAHRVSGPSCGAGGKQGCRREIGLDQVPGGARPCLRERRPGDLEQPWSVLRTPDQRDLMWARSRGAQRKLPRARSQPKHASRQGETRPKCHPLVDQDLLCCKRRSWLFRRQGPSLLEWCGRHSCTSLKTESTQSKTANWPSWQAARGRDGTSVLSKKQ